MTDEELEALAEVRAAFDNAMLSQVPAWSRMIRIGEALTRLERLAKIDGLGERGA